MAASLRCLIRANKLSALTRATECLAVPITTKFHIQSRKNSYTQVSLDNVDLSSLTDFEISKDPKEWQYIERILPTKIVPEPKKFEGAAPSGWVPPKEEALSLPYFVKRTKNHMQPVYLKISKRGQRHITVIRGIQGDIWQMEKELKQYVESKLETKYKVIASKVNEMTSQIHFRGDHVAHVKQWMNTKGF